MSAVLYSAWTFLSSYALIVKLRVLIKTRPLTSAQGRPYCEATLKNRKPCAADTARGFRHDTSAESETLISLCRSVRWYIRSRILLPPGNTPHITNKRPHTHKNMISGNPPVPLQSEICSFKNTRLSDARQCVSVVPPAGASTKTVSSSLKACLLISQFFGRRIR